MQIQYKNTPLARMVKCQLKLVGHDFYFFFPFKLIVKDLGRKLDVKDGVVPEKPFTV